MPDHIPYEPKICPGCDGHLEYYGKDDRGRIIWYCIKCNRDVSEFDIFLDKHSVTDY